MMMKLFQCAVGWGLVLSLCCFAAAKEPDWDTTARKVLQLSKDIDDRAQSSLKFASEDKHALQSRLERIKRALAETEKRRSDIDKTFSEVSQNRADLSGRYEKDMADMKTVEGAVRTALRHSIERRAVSPLNSFYAKGFATMSALLARESFLGFGDMQQYTDILFQDMVSTGRVEKKKVDVVGITGRIEEVELYHAGGFFLGYAEKDGIFALPNGGRPALSLLTQSATLRNQIKQWINGEGSLLPIDITGGAALRALEQRRGVREWIEAGGMLLYPILFAGFVGFLVALGKWLHLFGQVRLKVPLKKQFFSSLQKGQLADAAHILDQVKRCPASRVLKRALAWANHSVDVLDNALQEGYMRELSTLERALSIIGVLASIAPLLGLLGTVTGMIETFQAITIFGTGDPRMMSTGISEALITTQAGLGIAIPLLLVHHFLKRRIAFLLDDMEANGTAMAAILGSRNDKQFC